MDITEIIKFYRKQCNLTQSELGVKLGVSQDAISLWEKGKAQPNYEILRKMCIIFDIDGNEILNLETEAQRKQVKIYNSFNGTLNNNNINF